MQKQSNNTEKEEPAVEFEQCPVCESYEVSEANQQHHCARCGIVWVAERCWE